MIDYIFVPIFGVVFGSFLNVLIYRLPREENIATPPSSCPSCGYKLKAYDNIPILSYLLLRGKCRECDVKISIRYPIVEFLGGLIFMLVYLKVGSVALEFWIASIVFTLLLALSIIDIDHKMVPDSLNLAILSIALFHMLNPENLINALIMAGAFVLLRFYVSYFAKREALGEGDIPVAATMGALLGVKLALFAIFVAAIIALPFSLLTKDEERQIPFVPYLALGMFLVYLFSTPISAYLDGFYA